MNFLELGYFGLFFICFLSATILPLTSEGVLLLFLGAGYDPTFCLLIASTGNTLGGLSNYWLGLLGKPRALRVLFRNQMIYDRIEFRIQKYGYWLALISWVPFIGDPLTIGLGYFRVKFIPVLLLMLLAKLGRYLLVIYFWA